MAIASYELKTISRSDGRSATAAAAYLACCRIEDQTTGEIFDYSRKRGLDYGFTILPGGQSTDRAALWNAAEAAENRRNSVVARTLIIALPHEADEWERRLLVSDHAKHLARQHQVAVDVAIHEPPADGDGRNWHAHFLITTRRVEVDADGRIKLGAKTRELDERKTGSSHLEEWRQHWEDTVNGRLASKSVRLSMKSLKSQGIDREPTQHLGPAITALTRKERRLRKERRRLYVADDPERRRLVAHLRRLAKAPADMIVSSYPLRTRYDEEAFKRYQAAQEAARTPAAATAAPKPAPVKKPAPRPPQAAQQSQRQPVAPSPRPAAPAEVAPQAQQTPAPVKNDRLPAAAAAPEPKTLKPFNPVRKPDGSLRSRSFRDAASTAIHAKQTGDTPLLDAAAELLMAVVKKTGKAARILIEQFSLWAQAHGTDGLPKPLTVAQCQKRTADLKAGRAVGD